MVPITGVAGSSRRKTTSVHKQPSVASVIVSDLSKNIVFRRHVRFWDTTNKGYITPVDTAAGFMNLGYGIIISLTFGTLLTMMLAYATQDSWIPDPRCQINVQKLMRSRRRHHHPLFDEEGTFDSSQFNQLFDKYAQWDLSGNVVTLSEVLQMANAYNGFGANPAAWTRALLEWSGIYLLIGRGGVFKKADVRAAFDGTLFFRLRDSNQLALKGGVGYQKQASSLTLFPQAAVRLIEKQLNFALGTLPQSTSTVIERSVHNWLSGGGLDGHRLGTTSSSDPRLMDVPDDGDSFGHNDRQKLRKQRDGSGDTFAQERLTGTKHISLDKQLFSLTGVQGYIGLDLSYDVGTSQMSDISEVINSDDLDCCRDTPPKDCIGGTQLTGVRPSTLNEQHQQYSIESNTRETPITRNWLVQGPYDDESKEVDKESLIRQCIMEALTLSGLRSDNTMESKKKKGLPIVQLPEKEEHDKSNVSLKELYDDDHTTLPIVLAHTAAARNTRESTDEEASYKQITPLMLTGVRQEMSFLLRMHSLPIVEDHGQPKEETPAFEPVALSGLRNTLQEEEEDRSHTRSLLPIVKTPTTKRNQSPSFEPVALSGLSSSDTTSSIFSFVQAPESNAKHALADFEPVALSGIRGHDGYNSFFVQEPTDYAPKDPRPALEHVSLSGLRIDHEYTGFVQEPTDYAPKDPHPSVESVSLLDLRVDHEYSSFVQEPTRYEPEAAPTAIHLEPVALSGLRLDREYTGFVQEPTAFWSLPIIAFKPTELAGIRTDLEYTGFVQEPKDFKIKDAPADHEPVSLSGIRTDLEYSGFVKEPSDFERKKTTAGIEPVLLSGLRKEGQYTEVMITSHFVEVPSPSQLEPTSPISPEPMVPGGLCAADVQVVVGFAKPPEERQKPMVPVALEPTALSVFQKHRQEPEPEPEFKDRLLTGLRVEEDVFTPFVSEPTDYYHLKKTVVTKAEPVVLSGLREGDVPEKQYEGPLPIVAAPADIRPRAMTSVPEKIHLTGMSKQKRKLQLKNRLNMNVLEGVLTDEDSLKVYADPIELPKNVQEKVDLEQYRRHFPLSGLSDADLQPMSLKNWLNTGTLPGTIAGATAGDTPFWPYVQAGKTIPADYIQAPNDEPVPYMGGNIPTQDDTTPLKNRLNMDALPGTITSTLHTLYEKAVMVEEKPCPLVDLDQFRTPTPLPGIDKKSVRLKNWLNTSALPGVHSEQQDSAYLVYDKVSASMPNDYVEIQEDMQSELKALTGTVADNGDDDDNNSNTPGGRVLLKNWLSLAPLPGVQSSIYEDVKELTPEDYIEPPSPDMLGEVKLSGILSEKEEERRYRRRSSSTDGTARTEWDDAYSSSTIESSLFDASISIQESAFTKHHKLPMNWTSHAEIVEQKEE